MDFQTPNYICDYMVSLLPKECKVILEPTPGEGNIIKSIKRNRKDILCFEPILDFWEMEHLLRYNAIIMNPPFTPMEEGYKILYECMDHSDIIIALIPWLTIINSKRRSEDLFNFGLVSVTNLPRSVFKGSRVQTCILEMNKNFIGNTILKNYQRRT